MPIRAIRADITTIQCDAIVNPTNKDLIPGGGVDKAIDKAAGVNLYSARRKISPLKTAEAKITPGFNLPAKYIIHTFGPIWQDGQSGEPALLKQCYENVLNVAKENNCYTLAIPLISTGTYGFPKEVSLKIAISVINDFLLENEDFDISLVAFDNRSFKCSKILFNDVQEFLDENLITSITNSSNMNREIYMEKRFLQLEKDYLVMPNKHVTFHSKVIEHLKQKKMKDVDCYKRAYISKGSWSKVINSGKLPTRNFAIRTAIGLMLTLDETEELLALAGMILSPFDKTDSIIRYVFIRKIYDIVEINSILAAHGCEMLCEM